MVEAHTSDKSQAPLISILCNRFGPTYPIAAGAALSFFGLMMIAWSTKFYQFILFQSIFTSLDMALAYHPGKLEYSQQ
jgi:hypothetical protein